MERGEAFAAEEGCTGLLQACNNTKYNSFSPLNGIRLPTIDKLAARTLSYKYESSKMFCNIQMFKFHQLRVKTVVERQMKLLCTNKYKYFIFVIFTNYKMLTIGMGKLIGVEVGFGVILLLVFFSISYFLSRGGLVGCTLTSDPGVVGLNLRDNLDAFESVVVMGR